jgi:hypothetical protein
MINYVPLEWERLERALHSCTHIFGFIRTRKSSFIHWYLSRYPFIQSSTSSSILFHTIPYTRSHIVYTLCSLRSLSLFLFPFALSWCCCLSLATLLCEQLDLELGSPLLPGCVWNSGTWNWLSPIPGCVNNWNWKWTGLPIWFSHIPLCVKQLELGTGSPIYPCALTTGTGTELELD